MFNSIKKGLSIALAGVLAVSTISVSSYETQAAEVGEYNYAKLLQESLYFYDANMCGKDVGERSAFSWRDDCHTSDSVVIDGQTIDVSGGFHDAGDHGKFGLPQAYSATMLGISYYEYKDAYTYAGASEHLKTITNHFCEYFERCTVLNTDGSVKCFVYQVGDHTDHNYWGAPENQTGSRQAFCTSDSNTATDEVSEAASALTLQYLNFGDSTALSYAQKLFAYAKSHNKSCATEGLWDPATGGYLYNSTSWGDDYALAAALLYKATNDQSYKTEFNNVKNQSLGNYNIWAWCSWDDVSAIADYYGTGSAYSLNECAKNMKKSDNGYSCLLEWGSCRYNCNTQFLGLLYDKANGSSTYKDWATFQMNYILGNNNNKQCFVIGYNENSPQYPHHRAASGSGDANQISQNKKTLLGALVGGPKDANGTYTDNQGDYQCNEVALDYNAGLVCAAAALYHVYKDDTSVPSSLMTADDIADIDLRFDYNDILDECDHTWNSGVVTKNPTCTDKGVKTYTCTKCGETKTEDIAAKGHVPVTDNRVEPTTTSVGWTEGSHCSVCNQILVAQEEIPMLGKENDETEEEDENKDKEDNKEENTNSSSSANNSKTNQTNNGNESSKNSNEAGKVNTVKYSNEWVNGKWYNEDGTQTYSGVLTWKTNSTGWWVEDTDGWYPTDQWQKIDGIWYYFKSDGYMAANEYYNGYWFNADGSWDSQYLLSWKVNSTGWWVEDISGWWPSSTWLKINGYWYYFNASGYMVTSCYIDGYWIGSDGVCY